ncbi:MAG: DUF3291 domain-containing protein [Acidimicrobiia bacterium]
MYLAQLNIATLVDDPDSPTVREFMVALEPINRLGEVSPGFVWMLRDEEGDGAIGQRFPGHETNDRLLVNLTVWSDFDSLTHFVRRSGHATYVKRRREWFERSQDPTTVLWWIDEGHTPTLAEAAERLEILRTNGPTSRAFDLHTPFDDVGESEVPG